MGIPDDHYSGMMTSGEASHMCCATGRTPGTKRSATASSTSARSATATWSTGSSSTVVDPPERHFVLNIGPDHLCDPSEAAAYDPILERCAESNCPMICANPDLEVIRGGVRVLCAGALALRYLEMGGDARLLGKPDPRSTDP